ncbi:MAG: response regulator [Oscillatoria sp. SIO1A7]|nr:response regulator [Oscillatoria sp. SIO1A7]
MPIIRIIFRAGLPLESSRYVKKEKSETRLGSDRCKTIESNPMKEKVLIVDDNSNNRFCLRDFLRYEDFHVLSADNGLKGLQLSKDFLPDLVVCDIKMPKLDGYGFLQQLRADVATADIPFIFLTGLDSLASRSQARELGANDYLVKPVRLNKILQTINACLERTAIAAIV